MKLLSASSFFHISNLLTYFSIFLAVMVLFSVPGGWGIWNPLFLSLMVIFDLLDGRFAKSFKREPHLEKFGGQIDSLSDLLSFGFSPLVMIFGRETASVFEILFIVSLAAAFVYILCVATRLAAFNVMDVKDRFIGVPTTIVGMFWSYVFLFSWPLELMIGLMIIFSALMVSPISIPRPGAKGFIVLLVLAFVPVVLHSVRGIFVGV